jgi:short-subunit dehydrogenase
VPSRQPIDLSRATALVTGATGGIGRATAAALAGRGARLILTGRNQQELDALGAELGSQHLIRSDLADRADVDRLAEEAVAAGVDVLVANAALPASGVVTELDQAEIDRMIDVNLRAPMALARALAPGMIERRRGQLVFVSSLAGKTASPASSVYSATKFGLRGFALGLREDLRPHGVGVSVVAPGFIRDAGMFAETGLTLPPGVGTRSPEDVAAAIVRAIDRNPAEIDVAPIGLRLGARVGAVAPELASLAARSLGSARIARQFAERQSGKR